jgi:hypothetical protein
VTAVVRFLYLAALVVWLGEVVFFSFVGAPAIFRALDPVHAGEVVAVIFPRYYALGMGGAGVALVCALLLAGRAVAPVWWRGAAGALGLGLLAMVWAGMVVHPRAQQLRAALQASGEAPSASAEFRSLHARAVALNGVALLSGLVGLGLSAAGLRQ